MPSQIEKAIAAMDVLASMLPCQVTEENGRRIYTCCSLEGCYILYVEMLKYLPPQGLFTDPTIPIAVRNGVDSSYRVYQPLAAL